MGDLILLLNRDTFNIEYVDSYITYSLNSDSSILEKKKN